MRTFAISQFKAHALKILDAVAKTKERIVITKRGKALVEIVPYKQSSKSSQPGKLAHTLKFEKDIITPLGPDSWEAAQ